MSYYDKLNNFHFCKEFSHSPEGVKFRLTVIALDIFF